jgi:bacterioferritin (cytochrome b1)
MKDKEEKILDLEEIVRLIKKFGEELTEGRLPKQDAKMISL